MAISTKAIGGVVITDHSGAFLDALEKEARVAMNAVGKRAVAVARTLVPVGKTKRLYKGIGKTVESRGNELTLRVGGRDQKTHLFEYGTVKMARRPFIAPATRNLGEELDKEMAKVLERMTRETER